jgi:hypothetical protein
VLELESFRTTLGLAVMMAAKTTSGGGSISSAHILALIAFLYVGALVFLKVAPSTALTSSSIRLKPLGARGAGAAHKSVSDETLRPISDICKMFEYESYYRAQDFEELRALGRRARPGDMIELVAGVY